MKKVENDVREAVLAAAEEIFKAQLLAVRKLRRKSAQPDRKAGGQLSQVDMAYEVLSAEGAPMHVNSIVAAIRKSFKAKVDRESLVSAITKKIEREDRFVRTGRNTFGTRGE